MTGIDQLQLNFSAGAPLLINLAIAGVMFGVALDLRVADFRRVIESPRAPLIGLLCQFLLMPALASAIVWLWMPAPSVALGIILIAACPGGNVSNFLSSYARGDAALSVSMSAVSTLAAIIMTPLNFLWWGQLNPHTASLLQSIRLDPVQIVMTVAAILVLPTVAGVWVAQRWPALSARLLGPMRAGSIGFLLLLILGALARNTDLVGSYLAEAFWLVLAVNTGALALGYSLALLLGLRPAQRRAVSFETGIQNSGFGLLLIFNFFPDLGGMALVAAGWSVWHLISGLLLAMIWRGNQGRKALQQAAEETP